MKWLNGVDYPESDDKQKHKLQRKQAYYLKTYLHVDTYWAIRSYLYSQWNTNFKLFKHCSEHARYRHDCPQGKKNSTTNKWEYNVGQSESKPKKWRDGYE